MPDLLAESPPTDPNRLVLDIEALRFQMLKEFLIGFAPCLAIAHLGLHFLGHPSIGTVLLALTQWLALALSWALLYRNRIYLATALFCALCTTVTCLTSAFYGEKTWAYPYLIFGILAGLMFGRRGYFLVIGVSMSAVLAMVVLQGRHVLPPDTPLSPVGRWFIITVYAIVLAGPLIRAIGSLNGAVHAAGSELRQRRETEIALRASERRFRNIFNSVSDGILAYDVRHERFLDVNLRAREMFGYSQEEFTNLSIERLSAAGEASVGPQVRDLVEPAPDGSPRLTEWICQNREGQKFFAELAFAQVELDGTPCVLLIVRDIQERKNAEAQRQKLEQRLRDGQKMESLGRMAGGVAHDFNNLLTAINGFANMALTQLDTGGMVWEYVRQVASAGERAANVTSQLLAFSRNQVTSPTTLHLNNEIRRMEAILRHVLREDVALSLELAGDLPAVRFDPGQFGQILLNLAVNAREAMTDGGTLTIRTALEKRVWNDGNAGAADGVRLEVTDTGCGMSDEVKARIFEPFFTTKSSGTGQGLSIAYGAISRAGGEVDVVSEPGAGTTFRFLLPPSAADELETPEAEAVRYSDHSRRHGTILLVEDNEAARSFARKILHDSGYAVLEAAGADDVRDLLGANPALRPDLLVTDVIMPGTRGPQLARDLRERFPGLKVLFISGYSEGESERLALDPATNFLQKPFSAGALLQKMGPLLGAAADDAGDGRRR
jgi:two-component system, cell cycle sensor histidine kinase and response regulator CckA